MDRVWPFILKNLSSKTHFKTSYHIDQYFIGFVNNGLTMQKIKDQRTKDKIEQSDTITQKHAKTAQQTAPTDISNLFAASIPIMSWKISDICKQDLMNNGFTDQQITSFEGDFKTDTGPFASSSDWDQRFFDYALGQNQQIQDCVTYSGLTIDHEIQTNSFS